MTGDNARPAAVVWFLRNSAWRQTGLHYNLYKVTKKYATLPVTLYCGRDSASKEAEKVLTALFNESINVIFQVRHFHKDECTMKAVLGERVALVVLKTNLDGIPVEHSARPLLEDIHEFGMRQTGMLGKLYEPAASRLAFAVFGWGPKDPLAIMCKRSEHVFCQAATQIDQACKDLNGRCMSKVTLFDEADGDVKPTVQSWARILASRIEDLAAGRVVLDTDVDKFTGYEWSIDEVQLEMHLRDRRGMQDG